MQNIRLRGRRPIAQRISVEALIHEIDDVADVPEVNIPELRATLQPVYSFPASHPVVNVPSAWQRVSSKLRSHLDLEVPLERQPWR